MGYDFLIVPDGVTEIGRSDVYEYAFGRPNELKEILLPDSLTRVSDGAFMDCNQLETINIPNRLMYIGENAFRDCLALKRIELPEELVHIGEAAFMNCESIEKMKMPKALNEIGARTFLGCKSLEAVELPMNLERIGSYAFAKCGELTELIIPPTVKEIGECAFRYCEKLERIYIDNQQLLTRTSYCGLTKILPQTYPDAILQSYEVKNILDRAFFELLRPLMSTFRTSDLIRKMLKMHRERQDVVWIGLGMIVYQDSFVISYLSNSQYSIAFEAFMRGKKAGCSLMDCGYQVIDNSVVNCFGIIQAKNASRFSRQCTSTFLKDDEKSDEKRKAILKQIFILAREGVLLSPSAIWYNELEDRYLIFDYEQVGISDKETKDRIVQYQEDWVKYLS